jgi:predicted DNA-binding protein
MRQKKMRSVSQPASNARRELLNVRIDPELKSRFALAARSENKPVAEALRELIRAYVEAARQRQFAAEARRQSKLIADSVEEAEILRWMEDVSRSEAEE